MTANRLACGVVLLTLCATTSAADGRTAYAYLLADRVEYATREDALDWDLQGWYGNDYRKFWWKTEGRSLGRHDDAADVQLLYSRAMTAYFDWQVGLRFSDADAGDASSVVVGLQGLAPYLFEIDLAAYISARGAARFHAEIERDLSLSRRLVIQSRFELQATLHTPDRPGADPGINELSLGVRLRYEWHRKFAPYVGISWARAYGTESRELRGPGLDDSSTSAVVGIRFWF